MQEYKIEVRRTLIYMGIWTGLCFASTIVTGHSAKAPGLLLGSAASAIYFLLMCYRVKRSAGMPAGRAVAYMRSGWFVRLTFIVLILVLSVKMPQIDFLAAVVGLFTLQIVILFNAIYVIVKWFFSTKLNLARKG